MSRRDGASGTPSNAPATQRQNEYFVPRDGIDREVITADICRYLGNDALVRPGIYQDPTNGRNIQGYYITAYRNLTTAMIQDLKADSARWEQERRSHSGARYSDSSNRFSGAGPSQYPGSDAPGYSASGVGGTAAYQQYDNRQPAAYSAAQYPPTGQAFSPPAPDSRYQAPSGSSGYGNQGFSNHPQNYDNAYVDVGAHLRDSRMDASSGRVYSSGSSYPVQSQADPRYFQSQVPGSYPPPQPMDAFIGRGNSYPTSQADYSPSPGQPVYQYVADTPQYENSARTPPPRAAPSSNSQAQTGNSGSSHSRRDHHHRERDSYSKPSDRHSRRPPQ